ncbi:hypothetical protein, partial [Paenibacillus sp. cl123]|uniref:hypothetical protein n=1 Tax=Paenibacillus sp. cl123 TaxID=1761875 RepID=UPI001C40B009
GFSHKVHHSSAGRGAFVWFFCENTLNISSFSSWSCALGDMFVFAQVHRSSAGRGALAWLSVQIRF